MEAKPTRRRRGEVPGLLIDAARDLFASKGYARASTREIARLAGVSESLLFRHFGTKAELFNQAVLEPFDQFVTDFVGLWEAQVGSPLSNEDITRQYVTKMYEMLDTHKESVMALLAASAYEDDFDGGSGTDSHLSRQLDKIQGIVEQEREARGLTDVDALVFTRISFGTVAAMAVMGDWLFPRGKRRPSRNQIIEELVAYTLYGITGRAAQDGTGRRRAAPARR
ncbi:MAG: TetR/AcrR family transcriptional regulator [Acidimicrobiia bacterium]